MKRRRVKNATVCSAMKKRLRPMPGDSHWNSLSAIVAHGMSPPQLSTVKMNSGHRHDLERGIGKVISGPRSILLPGQHGFSMPIVLTVSQISSRVNVLPSTSEERVTSWLQFCKSKHRQTLIRINIGAAWCSGTHVNVRVVRVQLGHSSLKTEVWEES